MIRLLRKILSRKRLIRIMTNQEHTDATPSTRIDSPLGASADSERNGSLAGRLASIIGSWSRATTDSNMGVAIT